ncbi:hypothetical protein C7N43_13610 [Sphingobacteriales bacterium UPWRP_1]|nr:hypothetical protein BVG80_11580 [Sphingobacteriales bacterium TSM_CSM]PSJ76485.1 hypothetical protein C7N43_13610 [Sphingobacteriales bacterium UPWRP_1]
MQLKVRVKVNSINNLSDARYFATFAEWAGFNFNPNDVTHLPVATARVLMGWLSGPRMVGEFGNAPVEIINQTAKELNLNTIQTDVDLPVQQLAPQISAIIRRVNIMADMLPAQLNDLLQKNAAHTAWFLLNFTHANWNWNNLQQHTRFTPQYLKNLCADYNILLQLPFTPQNILQVLEEIQPAGIALNSGQEIKTGIRSFDDVADIIELLDLPE